MADGLAPMVIGILVASIGMSFGATTGYALNPARDFGPRLAYFILPIPNKGTANWQYAWVPIYWTIDWGRFSCIILQISGTLTMAESI